MLSSLYKYLVLNGHAGIPGIGSFSIAHNSATIQNRIITAPVTNILFTPGTALTDKKFYDFLAVEGAISEVDAIRKLQDFAYQLRKEIQANPFVELTGIGILKRNTVGETEFVPALSIDHYFPELSSSTVKDVSEVETLVMPVETAETTISGETSEKKDRWWIWALVLGILALAAIAFYYTGEGR